VGTLSELGQENTFDSVIYVDVLDVLEDGTTKPRRGSPQAVCGKALPWWCWPPLTSGSLPLSTRHWDATVGTT